MENKDDLLKLFALVNIIWIGKHYPVSRNVIKRYALRKKLLLVK